MELVDLHTHSCVSDGSLRPAELVREAARIRLSALALTDHDTIGGLAEAQEEADRLGIEFVRGCELSTRSDGHEVHILGLWIPKENSEAVEDALNIFQTRRIRRNQKILEKFQKLGFNFTMQDVKNIAGGGVIGRPHFAQLLVNIGAAQDAREAFDIYLGKDKKAYVPKEPVLPEEAVRLLSSFGATTVLAHPMLIGCGCADLEALITRLKTAGLNAIEIYHSSHSQYDERICADLAARHHLLCSGGSDFHGKSKPNVQLGCGKGGLRVPRRLLEELKNDRLERGLPC